MAARLRQSKEDGGLYLGQVRVAEYEKAPWGQIERYRISGLREWSQRYEHPSDCMQDAEADVRRLLKEAGVEVET
jgi:hypothetical protein